SQTYKENSSELSNARIEILDQLKSNGVDISLFEDKDLVSKLFDKSRFPTHSLNSQGLQMKKVLTYFRDLGRTQETNRSLDRLRQLRQQLNLDDELPLF